MTLITGLLIGLSLMSMICNCKQFFVVVVVLSHIDLLFRSHSHALHRCRLQPCQFKLFNDFIDLCMNLSYTV